MFCIYSFDFIQKNTEPQLSKFTPSKFLSSNISHKIKNKQENPSAKMKCYSGRMVFQYTVENERDMRSGVFLLSKLLLLLFCVITTHSRYVSCDGDDYI